MSLKHELLTALRDAPMGIEPGVGTVYLVNLSPVERNALIEALESVRPEAGEKVAPDVVLSWNVAHYLSEAICACLNGSEVLMRRLWERQQRELAAKVLEAWSAELRRALLPAIQHRVLRLAASAGVFPVGEGVDLVVDDEHHSWSIRP